MGVVRRSARSPACPLVCSVLCVNTGARLCRDWRPMSGVARHSPPIPGLRQLRTVLLVRVLGIAWAHCQYLQRLPGEPRPSNLRGRVQHLAKDFQGGYSYACGSGAPERGVVAERHSWYQISFYHRIHIAHSSTQPTRPCSSLFISAVVSWPQLLF